MRQVWARFDQNPTRVLEASANVVMDATTFEPCSTAIGLGIAEFERSSTKFGPIELNLGQAGEVGQKPNPISVEHVPSWPNRPNCGAKQFWGGVYQCWPGSTTLGLVLANVGARYATIGRCWCNSGVSVFQATARRFRRRRECRAYARAGMACGACVQETVRRPKADERRRPTVGRRVIVTRARDDVHRENTARNAMPGDQMSTTKARI